MQVKKDFVTPTNVKLSVAADTEFLSATKETTLKKLAKQAKVPGFRPGKAPLGLVEKQLDPSLVQSEFLDGAINQLYGDALEQEQLRPVTQPKVSLTKFVPFTALEFTAEVEVIGEVKLPEYTKIKLAKKPVSVTDKEVADVIEDIKVRAAEREAVKRAAADGDEVIIDFTGTDAKTGEPINGADGKAYPLILGSNAFIPGFEKNIVGMQPGDEKTFTLTFPKDYSVRALQNRKVSFTVTAQTINAIIPPKVDDAFAAKIGPFKDLAALKADIKKQLAVEKQRQADDEYASALVQKIADKASVAVPEALIDEEADRLETQERQNLAYRGQTWDEHLKAEKVSADQHRLKMKHDAEGRVKASIILSEIANREKITVTPEELDVRLQLLKGQYTDAAMQTELDKPENKRDILSRMITEKTLAKLTDYASK